MTLEELIDTLESANMLRIFKGDEEIFVGYLALFTPEVGHTNCKLYEQYKNDKVIRFRAVPEITHRKWKELNLMSPLKPDETPDFRFQELQMKLYYTIYLQQDNNRTITGGKDMKIIAVMSPKGGIGKTTTSDSIAYMLGEEQGKRVLVLDGDPQGDTSKTFGVYEPDGIGMSELLEKHECVGGTYKTGDLIRPTEYSHVDIIPANGYLMKTDMNLLLKSEDNQVTRLREALEEVSDAYDYCICDCGRLLDMVVINILIAAELIIAPVKVGGYEIEALQNLEEQIEDLRDINPDLRIKALMTMRQKNKTSLEVEEWLKAESGFDMFVTPIRRSIIAEKSTTAMIPLPKFSKRGIVSQDYRCVVHELLTEMEG